MTRLTLTEIGRHGEAIGEKEGRPVYVPYALPGEVVEAEIAGTHAQLREIVVPSPERIAAFCPHFTQCGGCQIQHWQSDAYRLWKRGLIVTALKHQGIAVEVEPLIDAQGEGRRRATLHVNKTAAGVIAGFNAARSHDIHPIDFCPILVPALASAPEIARHIGALLGDCDVAFTASETGIDVDVTTKKKATPSLAALVEAAKLARLSRNREPLVTRIAPEITAGTARIRLPAGTFLQATRAGEAALAMLVIENIGKAKAVADLFCGVGVFALRLAGKARIFAADSDRGAIAALDEATRKASGLKPVEAKARDLFREPLVSHELKAFDAVIFDPPRAGAEAQARQLAKSTVKTVVAVSCDPASFARDARILIEGGYRLTRVTPVDQFAFTAHVETVALFRR
ncbi:class I SAM-dependent RNA methyltransferase [Nordella sp. HKS 07]|uniref:class I SAM-dependent RNA methyltransferase n=1 Tax=Nordella sp. HKS 07 TaxID=2712222 RepID=UPI0019D0ABF9|nr:methyltransferase [Nordella sp. HKS 07]